MRHSRNGPREADWRAGMAGRTIAPVGRAVSARVADPRNILAGSDKTVPVPYIVTSQRAVERRSAHGFLVGL